VLWSEAIARRLSSSGASGLIIRRARCSLLASPDCPGDDGSLRFRFYAGDPNYKRLVSPPGLRATVVVDRASSQIMSVRFHGR
jgi:hypothetical protein